MDIEAQPQKRKSYISDMQKHAASLREASLAHVRLSDVNIRGSIESVLNHKLNDFLDKRWPPVVWDVAGHTSGLVTIYIYDRTGFIVFTVMFVCFYLLNIIFDRNTVAFSYAYTPTKDEVPFYKQLMIYNKSIALNQNLAAKASADVIDTSNVIININVYTGKLEWMRKLLWCIYFLGITPKSFSERSIQYFAAAASAAAATDEPIIGRLPSGHFEQGDPMPETV